MIAQPTRGGERRNVSGHPTSQSSACCSFVLQWTCPMIDRLTQLIRKTRLQPSQNVLYKRPRVDQRDQSCEGEHDEVEDDVTSFGSGSGVEVGHGGWGRWESGLFSRMRWDEDEVVQMILSEMLGPTSLFSEGVSHKRRR
jgi:hypothetical protein